MSNINQRKSRFLQVGNELYRAFPNNPSLQREFQALLEALVAKVNGSNEGLADIEQKGYVYLKGSTLENEVAVANLEKMVLFQQSEIEELKNQIEELRRSL